VLGNTFLKKKKKKKKKRRRFCRVGREKWGW
jgi:hypothetical protein